MFRRITGLLLSVVILLGLFCSCNDGTVAIKKYKLPNKISATKSNMLAQNDNYSLDWDLESKCLVLKDENNFKASSIPYEVYKSNDTSLPSSIYSSIAISYIEPKQNLLMEANSMDDAENDGYIEARKTDDGVILIYYFNGIGIAVPVEYKLTEEGLNASIIVSGIRESENLLYSVSILPFMASAKNDTDSYVIVPSGSGAVMYTDSKTRDVRKYSEPVYGVDEASQAVYKIATVDSVRLPIFGVKNPDGMVAGIITEGAESAYIEANAGESGTGYSNAYAKFCVRGYSQAFVKDINGNNAAINKYSAIINNKRLTVLYKTLPKDKTFVDLANVYSDYLFKNSKSAPNEVPELMLDFYGAALVDKSFLGIPYRSLQAITTFEQVEDIIKDIEKQNSNIKIVANLKGFGDSGLDYGKLANGFCFSGKLGNEKNIASLQKYCKDRGYILAVDYDTVYFNKSGNGYSKNYDTAKNANSTTVTKSEYSIVTHNIDSDKISANLLARDRFEDVAQKLNKTIQKFNLSAVSLSVLSNTAYSDYSQIQYYNKSNMGRDTVKFIDSINSKCKIITKTANAYAAAASDYIFASPTASSRYKDFDMEIPLYQAVFRGRVPMSGLAVNLASNPETEYLKAVTTGNSLYFTVGSEFNDALIKNANSAISASIYSGISDKITNYLNNYSDYLKKLGNARIVSYKIDNDLIYTTYDNGITSCVNLGYNSANSSIGKVEARSFIYQ